MPKWQPTKNQDFIKEDFKMTFTKFMKTAAKSFANK